MEPTESPSSVARDGLGFLVHGCGVFCIDIFSVTVDDTTDVEIRSRRNSRDICRYAGGTEFVVEVFGRIVIFGIGVIRNKPRGALGVIRITITLVLYPPE